MNQLMRSKFLLKNQTLSAATFSKMTKRFFCTNPTEEYGIVSLKNSEDLATILKDSKVPVIIDFYADWCPPCKKLTPILEKKVTDTKKFKLVKINVDDHQEIAQEYNVGGIPYVLGFKDGKKVGEFVGLDEAALNKMITGF